ncbi:hypothetical protein HYU06_06380 [Candidatus Woesearchaeota archaeon]|nr:hypothetical protein [Candidatus Woesearchaeota archaeon]
MTMLSIDKRFNAISNAYDDYYKSLLSKGKLLVRDTSAGIWGYASASICFEFFRQINLGKYKNLIDLGSGDGKVVAIASLFTNSVGIEADKELFEDSIKIKDKLVKNNVIEQKRCKLINDDFMKQEYDLSEYDLIFINPDKLFTLEFEQKLIKELTGTLYIYNSIFAPKMLRKGKTYWIKQMPIITYNNDKTPI